MGGSAIFSDDPQLRLDSREYEEGAYYWVLKARFCNNTMVDTQGFLDILK